MTISPFLKIEPNWSAIRPEVQTRLGRDYSTAYLSDIWRNHRTNVKVRSVLVELLGEPEDLGRVAVPGGV